MKPYYVDILKKAGEPVWYDEQGVPRYVPFHPNLCVELSAKEAFLVEVRCQGCGAPFLCALTWQDGDRYVYGQTLPPPDRLSKIGGNSLHYGDPPNVDCCQAGSTMNSEFHQIVEAWVRGFGPGDPWLKLDSEAINAIGAKSEIGTWE